MGASAVRHPHPPCRHLADIPHPADFAMNPGPPHAPWTLERALKWAVLGLLAYWAIYTLVVPVTTWDGQTYNVARLLLARYGGFFGNKVWNTEHQDSFPWAFDA